MTRLLDLVGGAALETLRRNPLFEVADSIFRLKSAVETWEREQEQGFAVLHRLPGRLRLAVLGLQGNPLEAERLEGILGAARGVDKAEANPVTGNLLLVFDPSIVEEGVLLRAVAPTPSLNGRPRSPQSAATTVRERSALEVPSRAKLIDVLLSASTLIFTQIARSGRRRKSAPPGLGRLFTAPAVATLSLGAPIFRSGLKALRSGTVNADTLSTVAIVASILTGKDLSALVILLLADIGEMVTAYSAERTRDAIAGMLSVGEPLVWKVHADGSESKVPLEEVRLGDTIVVHLGEKISVDGVVTHGEAAVDQASITGEFMPLHKRAGDRVYAGTVVTRGRLVVRAEQVGDSTAVARIIHQVEEASQRRAPIQNFADKFSQQLIPLSFGMAGLVYLLTRDLNRALNMLIIDYSCAVRLATATAFSSSVFNSARQGILVKGGSYLELLAGIDTLVLDKTGTVTEGRPTIVAIQPLDPRLTERELMEAAATAEQHAPHPLADAVVSYVKARDWTIHPLESEEIVVAHGVETSSRGRRILVGSRRFLAERGIELDVAATEQADLFIRGGHNVLYLGLDGTAAGLIALEDPLREDFKKAINRLRRLAIDDVILLTGDVETSAERIASRLRVDRYRANVLPEDKAEMIRSLQAKGIQVAMVGEGVNDAPALAHADIGIAMGNRGTDLAIETAHITIAGDDPLRIPAVIQIGRQTMAIVRQNFAVAVGLNTLAMVLGAAGYLSPMSAAVLHNLTTVGVVLNSTQLLYYKPKWLH